MYLLHFSFLVVLVLGAQANDDKHVSGNWHHNFNEQDHLDLKEWEIYQDCTGNEKLEQLNCNTNRTKNLELVDGALALTAAMEHYSIGGLEKDVTSAWIETAKGFDFKKIEIRMAMTQGRLLRPVVLIQNLNVTLGWPTYGQINFASYTHGKYVTRGLHASWDGKKNNYVGNMFDTGENLHEFQVYSVERNDTHIIWKLNDHVQLEFDTRQNWINNNNPFAPGNFFYITINLGVGGKVTTGGDYFFRGSQDVHEESKKWKCSSLLVDYVKVIGRDGQDDPAFVRPQETKASDICKGIMNRLKEESGQPNGNDGDSPSSISKLTSNISLFAISMTLLLVSKFNY